MSIVMSDDASLWQSDFLSEHIGGALYFIVPQRSFALGPIPMSSLIAYRQGHFKDKALETLENMKTNPKDLPDRERPTDEE